MSNELKEFIKGIEGQVICYCALGGKTGTGLTQSFASYFKEIHHPSRLKFVTTRPPSMRLWFSTDNAEEYRKKIVAEESMIHNTEVAVLYLAKSFNQRSLPYTELYKEVPKEMMDMDMFDLGDWWVRKTISEFLFPPSL